MSITKEFDTITAISTPLGEGAIGIVRLSGTDAVAIANKVFKGKNLETVASHTINYGHIVENDETIDEVMVSVMCAPKTFTREDVVEINTHGGVAVTNEILQLLIRSGARMAEPGEFTKRAFLNGRVDLTQAEAVMDLIRAKTDKAMAVAVSQLDGSLKDLINNTRQEILNTLAQVEVNIDYPEYDDVEEVTTNLVREKTQEFQALLENLLATAKRGKILREGLSTAIIGRPNVGKSSLLNNLLREEKAIVTDIEGTTRDVIEEYVNIKGVPLKLIDTAGIRDTDDVVEKIGVERSKKALEEADLVLFLVDVNTGLTDWDEDVALILRRAKLPVILVANKVDNSAEYYQAAEFYKLGLGDPQCISAATGGGTGDLLDMILDKLQDNPEEAIEEDIPRFAVVGRPNAGKSSIINAFIGEDRNIVTEIAGTTRDSIYTRYDKFGFDFYLVDTAGIRRKNKVSEDLEFYSVMRSIRAIENSDVCILMLDATRGIETQDMNIFQLIQKNNKSLVVVVNKWDLVEEKNQKVIDTFENAIRKRMAPFVDFPIIFASALTKQRIFRVLETAKEVYQNRKAHIGTSKLNEVMLPIIEAYPPQSIKGKYIKIKYCTQLPNTTIPSFVFYANLPQYVKENYRRFLENKIRENWSLHGCPINVFIRQK